jgi:hypothetical protein
LYDSFIAGVIEPFIKLITVIIVTSDILSPVLLLPGINFAGVIITSDTLMASSIELMKIQDKA